jgi:hypothetical protein
MNKDFKVHNIAARYILGENIETSIKGDKEQLKCLSKLLESSKKIYDKLNEEKVDLNEILERIEEKKEIADHFFSLTGIKWKF